MPNSVFYYKNSLAKTKAVMVAKALCVHFILIRVKNLTPFCDTKAKHCIATHSPPNASSAEVQTVATKVLHEEQIFKIPLVISNRPMAKNIAV